PVHEEQIAPKHLLADTTVREDSVPMTGRVIDARTKDPIQDAEVSWKGYPALYKLGSVQTDKNGRYVIKLKAETPYEISASSGKYFYDVFQMTTPPKSDTLITIAHVFALPETLAM